MKRRALALLGAALLWSAGTAACQTADEAALGVGWAPVRLDLEVFVERDPPGLSVLGTLSLRLELERSLGPTLVVNANQAALSWTSVDAFGATVEMNARVPGYDAARAAHVRFDRACERGTELEVSFALELQQGAPQLCATREVALGSWTELWYPIPVPSLDSELELTARLVTIPGRTTFHLPTGWIALSDGALEERSSSPEETRESWSVESRPVARSFAAGAYRAAERSLRGSTMRVYLLRDHPLGVDRLAELLAGSLAAQASRLGEFPFEGYGVAEIPGAICGGWYAASQQTFLMARSEAFDFEHGNLPLWAHEMGHAWWGNTVGTEGPGSKMVGEALAQLGALLAIEELEGRAAMVTFLEESRSGYNPLQCARGYFQLLARGVDHPLATLGSSDLSGDETHSLADSKGMWVWHMLRERIGDEAFFGVLRGLIREHAGSTLSLDELRAAFVAAAPERGLERFFEQWLDRTGAPVIDVSWQALPQGGVELVLTQAGPGDPYALDLELEVRLADGTSRRERIELAEKELRLERTYPAAVESVTIDPERRVLLWRAEYGNRPGAEVR